MSDDASVEGLKYIDEKILLHHAESVGGRYVKEVLRRRGARLAELEKGRCEHCGANTIDNCLVCGAPQCCPQCCRIGKLEKELAQALHQLNAYEETYRLECNARAVAEVLQQQTRALLKKG